MEANGHDFVMRGVNHPHIWFTAHQRVRRHQGARRQHRAGRARQRQALDGTADRRRQRHLPVQANRLICVLEVHDTTGYGEEGAAVSLDEAVDYWISQKSVLVGQENYVIINIGNEPNGNTNPVSGPPTPPPRSSGCAATASSTRIMVDAPNWGQDWQFVMRDNAADGAWTPTRRSNTMLLDPHVRRLQHRRRDHRLPRPFQTRGCRWSSASSAATTPTATSTTRRSCPRPGARDRLPRLVVERQQRRREYLDMATNFNPNQLTSWGQRIFNGPNGIKATSTRGGRSTAVRTPPPLPTADPDHPPTTPPDPATTPARRRRRLHRHVHHHRPVARRLPGGCPGDRG